MNLVNIDFHIHSAFSYDSKIELRSLLNNETVDVLAITDHDTFAFHERYSNGENLYKISNKWFITGEEIMTKDAGEIIGLFIKDFIKPKMSLENTIAEIKSQEGVVYLPHPYDFYRKGRPNIRIVCSLIDKIDIIEVFNAKYLTFVEVLLSKRLAKSNNKLFGYGSDAHRPEDIGKGAISLLIDEISKKSLLDSLAKEECIKGTNEKKRSAVDIIRKLIRRRYNV